MVNIMLIYVLIAVVVNVVILKSPMWVESIQDFITKFTILVPQVVDLDIMNLMVNV